MHSQELIDRYIQFFSGKGHVRIAPAALATPPDSSTLFISAGMQPLIPYLSGQPHHAGRRLVDLQPCLRTGDIDEVGDTSHLTFFEMLGNWSLGDYFKGESIAMSYEFLTTQLQIAPQQLWVTVFAGDADAPADAESPRLWEKLGLPRNRIVPLGRADNWWGPVGETGPCGPDTEIFIEVNHQPCGLNCRPGCSCGRFLEIWNNVFMAYYRTPDGRYEPLAQLGVDTGMGVERTAAILQGRATVFETELFSPLFERLQTLGATFADDMQSARIIADHLKAATFILSEGIRPGNKQQGYVARRLLRRAVDHGKRLGIDDPFTPLLAEVVVTEYGSRYPALKEKYVGIAEAMQVEEAAFNRTLSRGRGIFAGVVEGAREAQQSRLDGPTVFQLFDTYGIPVELTTEWAAEQGLEIDRAGFEAALATHKEISGGGSGEFAGGLAAHDEQTVRLHTATHLLHQALRDLLGGHVAQKGSHITPKRLRFDFSHPNRLSKEELNAVEQTVNAQIAADLPVSWAEMTPKEAKAQGAIGLFDEKYGELVKVYRIGNYSREICGGPHASRTGELGRFRILREQSNGAGIRRIRATLEPQNS